MNYFDPANGQAMGLEQRIAELFKADPSGSIEILELGKSYNRSHVDQLMTDVTEWFQDEVSQHRMEICSGNYSDISAFLSAVEYAFNHSIPPVTVTFSTLEDFWASISSLKAHSTVGPHYTFSCKANERGLFLNLKEWEIRRYGTDSYPMSFQFKEVEDFYKLPLIYGYYNHPIRNEQKTIHNEQETASETVHKNWRIKKSTGYILIATVISVIAGLYSFGVGGKADADHYSRQNDSEAVDHSHQKLDNELTDREIKERILDRRFCFDKFAGKDARGWVIEIIHEMYFWKGGTGMSRFKELDNTHGVRDVSREPFSWKVSEGEIYVTHANSLETEVFTFKPAKHALASDHIIDCSSGNEYSGDNHMML